MKPEDMDKIAEAIAMTLKEEGSQEKAKGNRQKELETNILWLDK